MTAPVARKEFSEAQDFFEDVFKTFRKFPLLKKVRFLWIFLASQQPRGSKRVDSCRRGRN